MKFPLEFIPRCQNGDEPCRNGIDILQGECTGTDEVWEMRCYSCDNEYRGECRLKTCEKDATEYQFVPADSPLKGKQGFKACENGQIPDPESKYEFGECYKECGDACVLNCPDDYVWESEECQGEYQVKDEENCCNVVGCTDKCACRKATCYDTIVKADYPILTDAECPIQIGYRPPKEGDSGYNESKYEDSEGRTCYNKCVEAKCSELGADYFEVGQCPANLPYADGEPGYIYGRQCTKCKSIPDPDPNECTCNSFFKKEIVLEDSIVNSGGLPMHSAIVTEAVDSPLGGSLCDVAFFHAVHHTTTCNTSVLKYTSETTSEHLNLGTDLPALHSFTTALGCNVESALCNNFGKSTETPYFSVKNTAFRCGENSGDICAYISNCNSYGTSQDYDECQQRQEENIENRCLSGNRCENGKVIVAVTESDARLCEQRTVLPLSLLKSVAKDTTCTMPTTTPKCEDNTVNFGIIISASGNSIPYPININGYDHYAYCPNDDNESDTICTQGWIPCDLNELGKTQDNGVTGCFRCCQYGFENIYNGACKPAPVPTCEDNTLTHGKYVTAGSSNLEYPITIDGQPQHHAYCPDDDYTSNYSCHNGNIKWMICQNKTEDTINGATDCVRCCQYGFDDENGGACKSPSGGSLSACAAMLGKTITYDSKSVVIVSSVEDNFGEECIVKVGDTVSANVQTGISVLGQCSNNWQGSSFGNESEYKVFAPIRGAGGTVAIQCDGSANRLVEGSGYWIGGSNGYEHVCSQVTRTAMGTTKTDYECLTIGDHGCSGNPTTNGSILTFSSAFCSKSIGHVRKGTY